MLRPFLKEIGTQFVACSDVAAKWMFPLIDNRKIKIIKNGIDVDKFKYDEVKRSKVRKELNFSDNDIVIGHVGRFCYQKNHPFLVKVFKEVIKENSNYRLLMVGIGPNEGKIKKLIKELKLEEYCIFYGASSNVSKLYQAMDIFLLPSKFEGLPIVGVEAQASGLPVIFSDKITRGAKIIDCVSFLPIRMENIRTWSNEVFKLSRCTYMRAGCSSLLLQNGFSIENTEDEFVKLYTAGRG